MYGTAHLSKEQVYKALENLPDQNPFEEALERLLFIASVQEGLDQAESGESIPHEEVMKMVSSWCK